MRHSLNNRVLPQSRSAFTLVELLVAIVIVVMISFLMVPFVTNLVAEMQNRGVTGAGRTIQSTFSLARDQSLRTAAPYGLRFVRDPDNPWLCRQIQYLQSPPALSGMNKLMVAPSQGLVYGQTSLPAELCNDDEDWGFQADSGLMVPYVDEAPEVWAVTGINPSWLGLVRKGDHLRINHNGPLYEIVGPDVAPRDGWVDQIPGSPALGSGNYGTEQANIYPWGNIFWTVFLAAEPFPNRDGFGGSSESRGTPLAPAVYRYQIQRQPVPAADQDEVVLPPGVVIDLKRTRGLWNQLPTGVLDGPDQKFGIAGVDDDMNGVVDDWSELGTPGSDDAPAGSWPAMDMLFSSTGEMTGAGAQSAVIHFWVGPQGLTESNLPVELAESRLVSVYTRSGFVQVNEINAADLNEDGFPDNPYAFAEAAFGTRPE